MKKITARIMGLMMLVSFIFAGTSFADEGEVVALRSQVSDLTGKVDSLERIVNGLSAPSQGANTGSAYVAPSTASENRPGLLRLSQDINMSGYIDVEYNQNLTANSSNAGGNPLRSFDPNQNTFSLNAAVLEFERKANPEGGAGFRFDVAAGENAQVVDTATNGSDGDEFSVQQLYAEWVAPLSFLEGNDIFDNTIDFKVGRYITLAGAEVIRSPDNWNVSRGLLFGLAIPYTHTGIRATYNLFNDRVTTYWGLNNGWDNVIDNNQMKTAETGFSVSPLQDVTWKSVYLWGPENARQGGHRRFLMTNVLAWQATDRLKFMGEIDFGSERRVVGLEGRTGVASNTNWQGYAAHVRFQATDKFAMAYRLELFRDPDAYRVAPTGTIPDDDSVVSQTLTAEYLLDTNLTGRLEYRWDHSNDREEFNGENYQSTLGAQLIYNFS